jgi:hypothetical protein
MKNFHIKRILGHALAIVVTISPSCYLENNILSSVRSKREGGVILSLYNPLAINTT